MSEPKKHTIYTIGHSTHPIQEFITMLKAFNIEVLVDIRTYPGSRRYPQFNREALEASLQQNNIRYIHMLALGGRRKPVKDSHNTAWRHEAFRGYADYMETNEFKKGIQQLENIALKERTVYMCSEAVWWSCHRSLVSDYLKIHGWKVLHIMSATKTQEHPYTSASHIINGELSYRGNELF
ncbi:MAG: DUF488 domain-containing protein [Chitinophagaceae bacterium]|nr:DUF488 domain-containing protein [Chitinophagaceae bacterium]